MDYWVGSVLTPYVTWVRGVIGQHVAEFLILDWLKAHLTSHVREAFERAAAIIVILPARQSHLYQVLDLCTFGVIKKTTNSREATAPSRFQG
jgi:hypothetical protein